MRSGFFRAPLFFVGMLSLWMSTSTASASIVPSFQERYVTSEVSISYLEDNDSNDDTQAAFDFDPFLGAVAIAASAGPKSVVGAANQDSMMDALEIHATGDASTSVQSDPAILTSGFSKSLFSYAFTIDVDGIYNFDAAVLVGGNGNFSSDALVEFKSSGGSVATLSVSGNDGDFILPTPYFLEAGNYTIDAVSTAIIRAQGSSASTSFDVNLVYVSPEPGTLILLLFGGSAILMRRRAL